ncbi:MULTISPECIES: type I DNA topoisomerase [unclassified Sedimentibacter]|uniref:type I DNA topoisomerase n=1 Tax=unclassified Sedimentibacter TaxID=2649220 RepID=UPI0027DFC6AD|nr:type I DNA topoisomerase [Sedimentibacter sp. MB35-C1]WMJ76128.1 type I DNA topoisomerase [Sedimentibacter sp. MB35-C1]
MNNLLIVESPAKAKTIGKFLGKNYTVKASVGHIRDLPKSKLGIDIEQNFEPNYITIRGKGDVLKELRKEAKKADKIYLATDPDREGEAISWHLAKILNLDEDGDIRIEFNEITKDAIKKASKNPRKINLDLVDAQQARRVLDRLVGYNISPLLWKKIEKGLSAGRVQSVTLKLIIDREREIMEFVPEEYWTLELEVKKQRKKFGAKYVGALKNNKVSKVKVKNQDEMDEILNSINKEKINVFKIDKTKSYSRPSAPFTTSSLQQEANRRINFTAKKTMMVAQQLYEGINIKGEGSIGLVTYIRTDSFRLSDEAVNSSKEYITKNYGEKYYQHRVYTKPKKNGNKVQDAHEAIRPTSVFRNPDNIKDSLSTDQYKLYSLIWKRFVSSQMVDAQYDVTKILLNNNENMFEASGKTLVFDGYKSVYKYNDGSESKLLPEMEINEILDILKINPEQHFTQPPARYSEASLIKDLEERGIGRPSTYAPIITTITGRDYVVKEKGSLLPTDMGFLVTEMMEKYFSNIVNEKFTAELENNLDEIASGKKEWHDVISEFYGGFKKELDIAEKEMEEIEIKEEVSDVKCEKCGEYMVVKKGRYGKFLACPNYPECKNTKPLKEKEAAEETDEVCEVCGSMMLKRKGRYGEFLACSNYPKCKNTKPIIKTIDVNCPLCGGKIAIKFSKAGRRFFGCSNYPDCKYMSWLEPTNEKCPKCGEMMVIKDSKPTCINKNCI